MTKATTHYIPADEQVDMDSLNDEERARAQEILKGYNTDDRPTVVLPGSHGTVSGTAVSEWVDENGNPKYGHVDGDVEESAAPRHLGTDQ